MSMKITRTILLGLSLASGCAPPGSPSDSSCADLAGTRIAGCAASQAPATTASVGEIKDVPAIDHRRYPDSVGYLYQSSLATIFWLQNEPRVAQSDDLVQHMERVILRGVAGEILTSTMQHVDSVPDTQPTLQDMATGAVQSVRAMAQYAFVTSDYEASLGSALNAYNTDPARQQAITDAVARVDAGLRAVAVANPTGPLPAAPPPPRQQLLRSGKYFADSVKDHARERLTTSANSLQRAIDTRNVMAYAAAFGDVFFRIGDADLARSALEALATHHVNGILTGHPLDAVINSHVASRDPGHPFAVDQLTLINQINLLSNDMSKPRHALVAALLLIDEDHRQVEADPTLSSPAIWDHIGDVPWLVSQLVRIKADGTTAVQVDAVIDSIVASL